MNHNSSRSHVILQLDVEVRNQRNHLKCASSAILLADLAGSEGMDKTQTKGKNTLEGAKINTSLLSLSKVVKRLSQNEKYIGFRDSKLTMVLQPILIGNCLTSVVCTVNTTKQYLAESINTLKFGTCAGVVQRKADLSSLDKGLENSRIGKEVLQELDELNEKYEEAQQQLSDKNQALELLTQEHQALRVQVDLLQNEKNSYLKEIDRLRQEVSKAHSESSKIAQMIDGMESKIIAEKEAQFKHMFDQQNVLIRNLEEEVDRLKSSKQDGIEGRRPINTRDLAPCYKKTVGSSMMNSAEPNIGRSLMMDSMETIPEEPEGFSKRHAEIITKLREDNESMRDKLTQTQKENLRVTKINHMLRNDLEGLRKHIEDMEELDRPRKNVRPVFAFDRNGDPVSSRVMASPSKEEYKKTLLEVERKKKAVERRLDEARAREDKCRQGLPRLTSDQEHGFTARGARAAGASVAGAGARAAAARIHLQLAIPASPTGAVRRPETFLCCQESAGRTRALRLTNYRPLCL